MGEIHKQKCVTLTKSVFLCVGLYSKRKQRRLDEFRKSTRNIRVCGHEREEETRVCKRKNYITSRYKINEY